MNVSTAPQPEAPAGPAGTRIQSVARAIQILLWVADQPHGATAKEIAASQDLALPTTYHLVNTLVDQGLLAKDAHRRHVLGRGAAVLAQAYLRGRSVSESMLRTLRELAVRTEETVYLADWGEHDIRVLASVEGSQMVRVAEVASGPYEYGHARANGKVLLAFAWPEVRDSYLLSHPLTARTPATITDRDELEAELTRIRKRGFALDVEEFATDVCCVAAPLLHDGCLVAAMGISVPAERFKQRRKQLTSTLLELAEGFASDESPTTRDGGP